MGLSVFVILFTCTVAFDQHSYTNPLEDEAAFSQVPDVPRYNDRRLLDGDGDGGRDVDDARSYAKGPRARSLSQRPTVQSEDHASGPGASFDLRPRVPTSKNDHDAAPPRRLEAREPDRELRWRASPNLRRQRVEAYDARYDEGTDVSGEDRRANHADRARGSRGMPDRDFPPEEERTDRVDREVERIDREHTLKEDREEDFDEGWERLKQDRLDQRYHHSLIDETALDDSRDSHKTRADRENHDSYEDRAASKKRWTRSMHRSDEGRDDHHSRPRFVYDWQEDGGIVDCPPGGCARNMQNFKTIWTLPYWVDGPGFKLALASLIALTFLYILNLLSTPRITVYRKGGKPGRDQKRSGDRDAGRSADPSQDFAPGVSRIRSIHQIETDSEDDDATDESGDEVGNGHEDEQPSGKQSRRRPRRGRREPVEGSKRRDARRSQKSRAKAKRTGTD